MTRALWAVGSLLAMACMPPLHAIAGARCDPDHACPRDYTCIGNACTESAGAGGGSGGGSQVVFVDDFEAGVVSWETPNGARIEQSTAQKNGGLASLRATVPESRTAMIVETSVGTIPAGAGRYCARAFVRHGTAAPCAIRMQLRAHQGSTFVAGSDVNAPGASQPNGATFRQVKCELGDVPASHGVTVRLDCGSPSPAEMFIDDVTVERTSGACP